MSELQADIAILGSGFAGSLTALIAERLGLRPVVVDRATHPRFTIGESSTPVANMILRDLAARYDLPQVRPLSTYGAWKEAYPHLGVGRKRGFSYFYHRPGVPFRHDAHHRDELLVAASSDPRDCDTHWKRADVDAFLAGQVRAAGIPLLQETAITSVARGRRGWQLRGHGPRGGVSIEASFLVDGTGAAGVLPAALDLPRRTSQLRTHSRALFGHFAGVAPWQNILQGGGALDHTDDHPFPCDQAALHHVTEAGWMWLLRFDGGLVSAGTVVDSRRHPLDPSRSPADEWAAWVRRYPSVHRQFAEAEVVDPPGAVVRTGRLQRQVGQATGPDWALLPHTAGFVDPIHSTGIAHTLAGIERLARILDEHWGQPTLEAALGSYEQALLQEIAFVDRLAALYYQALGDFRRVTTATLCYFAAITTYERLRVRHREERREEPFERLFLCAGDARLQRCVRDAAARLSALEPDAGPKALAAFEQHVAASLAPYNEVGLFHPPIRNMYPHTAAPV